MNTRRAVIDQVVLKYPEQCSSFTFKFRKGIEGQEIHKEGFVNCYWNSKSKLIYMHIDKCGSTSITTTFDQNRMNFVNMDKLKNPDSLAKFLVRTDHTFFTVTRDPVSRWISGLNEFMCRFKAPLNFVIEQVKNKKYVFDEHTAPQHLFLTLCLENQGNIKYLKLDSDLSDKVNNLLKEYDQDHKYVEIPHLRNSKNFIPNYTGICKKIYECYVENDNKEFNELYKIDYEIYNSGI